MDIRNFTVGRDAARADVEPAGGNLDTVSHCHLAVQAKPNGLDYRIQDLGSANGTFAMENGAWIRVDKAVVKLTTPLRLGLLETTVQQLLSLLPAEPRNTSPARPGTGGRVFRDPTTGEIIIGN